MTINEAAQYLGFSANTLRNWDSLGKLVPIRTPGNQRRYTKDQLDSFFATLQAQPAPQPREFPLFSPDDFSVPPVVEVAFQDITHENSHAHLALLGIIHEASLHFQSQKTPPHPEEVPSHPGDLAHHGYFSLAEFLK